MGNVDMTKNQAFMLSHSSYTGQFYNTKPLFYAEDIKFPLYTKHTMIIDSTGRRVKLAGGNFSGGHLCRECVDGLECRPLRDIAMDIKYKFSFNCIRLTYSLQMYFDNKVVKSKYLKANPQLIGKTAMQIFDYTIKVLTDVGLMVILNNHTSSSMWCCTDNDGDGLWWSYQYPQNMFFECAEAFAKRYKDNPLVIGTDIRNEIRKAHGIEGTWGDHNPLTDWRRAAKKCSEKVLAIAPHWLILVGGLHYQLDLTGVQNAPLQLSVPNKLVYSGHFYSFSWPPSWASFNYESFKKKFFNSQTFIRGYGIPYVIGEFGNNKRDGPWKYLIKYLRQTDIDWIYWPIDGFKCDFDDPKEDETYGIFDHDFREIRNPDIFQDLRSIGAPQRLIVPQPLKNLMKQSQSPTKEKVHEQEKKIPHLTKAQLIEQSSHNNVGSLPQFVAKDKFGTVENSNSRLQHAQSISLDQIINNAERQISPSKYEVMALKEHQLQKKEQRHKQFEQ